MSGDESVAEEIHEAALELVNPGGDPEVLRDAAKGWRQLSKDVDELFRALNTDVNKTVGDTWRGEAADAFQEHFRELKKVIDEVTPDFDKASDGLEEAADNIEVVNKEIHEIYVEIGISIGVSVAMSFVTLGFSAAAGAARAAQLAARAIAAAGRLGRALQRIAQTFRVIYTSRRFMGAGKIALDGLANFAGGTAGGVATSLLSGKGMELQTNLIGGAAGATVGTAVGKGAGVILEGRRGGNFASSVAGGAAGGFTGDYLDSVRKGEDFNAKSAAVTAVTGGAAAGTAGEAVRFQTAFTPHITQGQELAVDVGINSAVPVGGGVVANESKDSLNAGPESEEHKAEAKTEKNATESAEDVNNSNAAEKIKEDFG